MDCLILSEGFDCLSDVSSTKGESQLLFLSMHSGAGILRRADPLGPIFTVRWNSMQRRMRTDAWTVRSRLRWFRIVKS